MHNAQNRLAAHANYLREALSSFGDSFELSQDALGLRKEDTDLLEAINKQLGEMLANGKLLAILQPFGFSENELPPVAVTAEKLCAA